MNPPRAAARRSRSVVVFNAALAWIALASATTMSAQNSPAIIAQPQSQTIAVGSNAVFSVSATGQSPLTYRWFFNGAQLFNGGRISGAGTAALAISGVVSNDAGYYWVTVSNRHGMVTSDVATLMVFFPPRITLHPPDQMGVLGSSVTFIAAGTGDDPLIYRWQRNGTNLSNGPHVNGAETPALMLSDLRLNDEGSYRLVVSNIFGAAFSGAAKLRLVPIRVWGYTNGGQLNLPSSLTNAVTISAQGYWGEHVNLGLKSDGTIAGWGSFYDGTTTRGFAPSDIPAGLSDVTAISAGIRHGLALRSDGSVVGVGNNSFGQTNIPAGLKPVVRVGAGGLHSLLLQHDGTPVGWGYETAPPPGLTNLVAIAPGYFHSLAIKDDGTVIGWGLDWYGQQASPPGLSNVVEVSAGSHHSLALKSDGTVVGWGYNYHGQASVPAGLSNVIAIAAGYSHSLALRSDGTVVAWGNNEAGQANVPAGLTDVVAIAAANNHSLALVRSPVAQAPPVVRWQGETNRTTFAGANLVLNPVVTGSLPLSFQWHLNDSPLADGTNRWLALSPIQMNQSGNYRFIVTNSVGATTSAVVTINVVQPWLSVTAQPTAQVVAHGGTFTFTANGDGLPAPTFQWQRNGMNLANGSRVTGANSSTLIITAAQISDAGSYRLVLSNAWGMTNSDAANLAVVSFRVWGNNFFGQTNVPLTMTDVVAASAGAYYNLVLKSDGMITGWGFNGYFQTAMPWGLYNPVAIAAGNNFSLAIAGDGRVWAWGVGDSGQTAVPPWADNAVAISGGGYHGLALKRDGSIVGWGYNSFGQATPPAGTNFVAIAAGGYHSAALRNDGKVIGFGYNYPYGQATPPANLNDVVSIAAGMDHCLALKSDGTVAAWGDNYYGQSSVPYGLNNVIAIAAGHFHNLALRRDGTIAVWGDNSGGQSVAPAGLSNVVAVAGGNFHSLAFLENPAVQTPPSFLCPPTDRIVVKDSTTLFKPQLLGSLPMSFQWLIEGAPLAGQTNPWLLLNTLQTNQSGGYQLVASNRYGIFTSAVARLEVIMVPPTFTQQPQSADRPVGSSHSFSATVSGSTPLSYQWFFDSSPLPGQTATALPLTNLQTNQAGDYWLFASNAAGVATSQVAVLNVGYPPTIVVAPSNQAVALSSNLVLAVSVTGSEPISYQWRKNYGGLSDDARINGATSNVLTITCIQTADIGNYDVIVSSPFGLVSTPLVSFSIVYPPTISAEPVSQTVPAGTNVTFSVTAGGTAPLAYQWRFNSVDLLAKTNSSLTLTNVQAANVGDYAAVVSNAAGMITSAAATLTVLATAPTITSQPVSRVVSVGQNASFTVSAQGSEPMTCQWRRDGTNLPGANGFVLNLANVNSSFNGTYRAAVSNAHGYAVSAAATLTVSPVWVWPTNNIQISGSLAVPATATNVMAITAGTVADYGRPCFALRADGSLIAWGGYGSVPAIATNVVALSSGGSGARGENDLALREDGTVVHWRSPSSVQSIPAAISNGNLVAVAAGAQHQLVLRPDGTVFSWGSTTSSVTNVPPGATNIIAIAAGNDDSLALRADGTVVVWGPKAGGQAAAFSNQVDVTAISAAGQQVLGLLGNGHAIGYVVTSSAPPTPYYGPPPTSATNLTALGAGLSHSLALCADGTALAWGSTNYGNTLPPLFPSNLVAIAAGSYHCLALVRDPFAPSIPPRIGRPPSGRTVMAGQPAVFNALAVGGLPLAHQWLREGLSVVGQTKASLIFTNVLPSDAGDYQLVALNDFGSVTSAVATVSVAIPQPLLQVAGTSSNGFTFSFASIAGVIYITEFKADFAAPAWTELERRFGSGGLEVVTDATAGQTMRLYRVRAVYAPAPRLGAATRTGDRLGFSFPTVSGANYIVQFKTNVDDPVWQELFRQTGTGAPLVVDDPVAGGGSRFYQVRVE